MSDLSEDEILLLNKWIEDYEFKGDIATYGLVSDGAGCQAVAVYGCEAQNVGFTILLDTPDIGAAGVGVTIDNFEKMTKWLEEARDDDDALVTLIDHIRKPAPIGTSSNTSDQWTGYSEGEERSVQMRRDLVIEFACAEETRFVLRTPDGAWTGP